MAAGLSFLRRVGVLVCAAALGAVLATAAVAHGQAAIFWGTGGLSANTGYSTVPLGSVQELSFQSTSSNQGDFAPGTIARSVQATQLVAEPFVAQRPTGPVVVPAGTVAGTVQATSTALFTSTGVSGSVQTNVQLADLGTEVRNMSIVTTQHIWRFEIFQPTEYSLFVRNLVPTAWDPGVLAECWTYYNIMFAYRDGRPPTPEPLGGVLTGSGGTTFRGVLQPDMYFLWINTYDSYITSTSGRLSEYSFALIPSPAPTATLALGLLTLARRRR